MATEIQEVPTVGKRALRWMALVCVVSLIAAVVLAQMWLGERERRRQRERQVQEMLIRRDLEASSGLVGPALDRNVLGRRRVMLDGQAREAMLLGPQRARQLGLESGDVVIVEVPGQLP